MARSPKTIWAVVGLLCFLGAVGFINTPLWFVALVLALIAISPLLVAAARKASARARFDLCALRVLDRKVRIGGVARVLLSIEPKRPVKLNSATFSFWTEEKAVNESGRSSRTYRVELHRWSTPIDVPPLLESSFEREILVPIPRRIPPTFAGKYNFLQSFCRVDLDILGAPDVELEREIRVVPERADG